MPHLPLVPDKRVNKQIPSLTDVDNNGYENKKVKNINPGNLGKENFFKNTLTKNTIETGAWRFNYVSRALVANQQLCQQSIRAGVKALSQGITSNWTMHTESLGTTFPHSETESNYQYI